MSWHALSSITIPSFIYSTPAASILLPIGLGSAVGYSTQPKQSRTLYDAIKQPPLRPPGWVFGPVWTLLYGMMGYASHRATTIGLSSLNPSTVELAQKSHVLYTAQLGLNLMWMPLFFGLRMPKAALADIVVLTGSVGLLASWWKEIDRTSAWLLAPYLGWLGFATYITAGVGVLNQWDISDETLEKREKSA